MGLFSSIGGALAGVAAPVTLLGTALAGGEAVADYFGQQQTNRQNAANVAATNATNEQIANQSDALQMQLAESGLSMKIADAAQYGISPLAAIGAADPSINPAIPNIQTPEYQSPLGAAGRDLGNMGQNIARAISATQTPAEKAATALDLQGKKLQNDYLQAQIDNARLELVRHANGPGIGVGAQDIAIPSYQTFRDPDGTTYLMPSRAFSESSHGTIGSQWSWMLNNKLVPSMNELSTNLGPSGDPGLAVNGGWKPPYYP